MTLIKSMLLGSAAGLMGLLPARRLPIFRPRRRRRSKNTSRSATSAASPAGPCRAPTPREVLGLHHGPVRRRQHRDAVQPGSVITERVRPTLTNGGGGHDHHQQLVGRRHGRRLHPRRRAPAGSPGGDTSQRVLDRGEPTARATKPSIATLSAGRPAPTSASTSPRTPPGAR